MRRRNELAFAVGVECAHLNQAFSWPKALVVDLTEYLGLRNGVGSRPGRTAGTSHDLFRVFEAARMVCVWAERKESPDKVIVAGYAWFRIALIVAVRKQLPRQYEHHRAISSDQVFIAIFKLDKAAFYVLAILHGQNKHSNRVCNAAACVSRACHTLYGHLEQSLPAF